RPRALRGPPALRNARAPLLPRIGGKVQLQAAWLPGDVGYSLEQAGDLIEQDVAVRRDIEDTVIGSHEESLARPELPHESPHGAVEVLEGARPFAGLPTVSVARHVELRNVDVEQSGARGLVQRGCGST